MAFKTDGKLHAKALKIRKDVACLGKRGVPRCGKYSILEIENEVELPIQEGL